MSPQDESEMARTIKSLEARIEALRDANYDASLHAERNIGQYTSEVRNAFQHIFTLLDDALCADTEASK